MNDMWWLADPLDLFRIEERVSTVYVERCHVDRDENAVVFVNRERTVRVPATMVGAVLLGPGTRVTHAAMRLLADSGTSVCWVGEHGVRTYAPGLGPSRSSDLIMRQAWLVTRVPERLRVAREMYGMRFPDEDVSTATMQQLRGREGARVKRLYRIHADRTGVPWSSRKYAHGDPEASDQVNLLLSMGNSCLYGACHAAIVGIGASPALGFVHTGHALSFVLDIADLYKAEFTIPLAFELAARGSADETDVRYALRDAFKDGQFMRRVVRDVRGLLVGPEPSDIDLDGTNRLWDELSGLVDGGVNWSEDHDLRTFLDDGYLTISGPDIPPVSEW